MAMVHYEGTIGKFDYDDEMFFIDGHKCLELREGYKGPIDLPKGVTSCANMFWVCDLTGCYFRDFDTSMVTDMSHMFWASTFPKDFTLGDKFDTSNVVNMSGMFCECKFSAAFSLGNSFDTSKVESMYCMFQLCKLPSDFSLGDKFDTSRVIDMECMFLECELPEEFRLSDKFDTSSLERSFRMFYNCFLGDKRLDGDAKDVIEILKSNAGCATPKE